MVYTLFTFDSARFGFAWHVSIFVLNVTDGGTSTRWWRLRVHTRSIWINTRNTKCVCVWWEVDIATAAVPYIYTGGRLFPAPNLQRLRVQHNNSSSTSTINSAGSKPLFVNEAGDSDNTTTPLLCPPIDNGPASWSHRWSPTLLLVNRAIWLCSGLVLRWGRQGDYSIASRNSHHTPCVIFVRCFCSTTEVEDT